MEPREEELFGAFRFFRYRTKSGRTNVIWNSRVGAVPNTINEFRSGERAELDAVSDLAWPTHIPNYGDRVIGDINDVVLDVLTSKNINKHMKSPGRHATAMQRFQSRKDYHGYLREIIKKDVPFHLYIVGADIRDDFAKRATEVAEHLPDEYIEKIKASNYSFGWIDIKTLKPTGERFSLSGIQKEEVDEALGNEPEIAVVHVEVQQAPVKTADANAYYDRKGNPIDVREFESMLDESTVLLASSVVDDRFVVMTIWLGIDVSKGRAAAPMIFESRVFDEDPKRPNKTRQRDDYGAFYSTEEDAFRGHSQLVQRLQKLV